MSVLKYLLNWPEVKWKGPFLQEVRPKFAVPFLTNRFTALFLFTYVQNLEKE